MPARIASLAALLALALLATGCGSEEKTSSENASPDTTAVSTPMMQRTAFDLKDYEGQVVVLNFWATWCAPCRAEMPDLAQLQKDLGDEGLQIIGVADRQGKQAVVPYLKRQPVNYPIVTDPQGEISASHGGIAALPTTLIIGRDGTVRRRIVGRIRADQLRGQLKEVLAGSASVDSSGAAQSPVRGHPSFIKS